MTFFETEFRFKSHEVTEDELERIEEYDVLAALLNDVHGSNDNRATRY